MTAALEGDPRVPHAEAFVKRAGYDPRSPEGQRRVNAIMVAAEVCETWAQFTRAAQAAVEVEFGTTQYDEEMVPLGRVAILPTLAGATSAVAGAFLVMNLLFSLAQTGHVLNPTRYLPLFG